jgi:hypothetical protein
VRKAEVMNSKGNPIAGFLQQTKVMKRSTECYTPKDEPYNKLTLSKNKCPTSYETT